MPPGVTCPLKGWRSIVPRKKAWENSSRQSLLLRYTKESPRNLKERIQQTNGNIAAKFSRSMSVTHVLLIFLGATIIIVFRVRCFFHLGELSSSDHTNSLRLLEKVQKTSYGNTERDTKQWDNIIHVVNSKRVLLNTMHSQIVRCRLTCVVADSSRTNHT